MNPQKQIQKYIYKNNLNYFIQRSFYIINQGGVAGLSRHAGDAPRA